MNLPANLRILLLSLCAAAVCDGAVITIPPGLNPGEQYRLIFLTAGGVSPLSTSLSVYDNFATSEANQTPELAALGTTWSVVGSVAGTGAAVHIGTFPGILGIYRVDGVRVATSEADLFDSSIEATVNITQSGGLGGTGVWTGTAGDGLPVALNELGAASVIAYGNTSFTTGDWLFRGNAFTSNAGPGSIYAISGVLTVPNAQDPGVPEPATFGLTVIGLMAAYRIARGKQRASATSSDGQAASIN